MRSFLLLMMAAAGCGGGGGGASGGGGGADMAGPMCSPSPEVCDGKDNNCDGKIDNLTPASANKSQLLAVTILLPKTRTDYAIDLNGDGRLDNQLSALVAILKSQGNDANAQVANSILSGDQILLFDELSADPSYQSDACAAADVYTGVAQPMPNLTGGGHFTVDTTVPSGNFIGFISGGDFESVMPLLQTTPVKLTLELVMFPGKTIALPIVGAQLKIVRGAGGAVSGEIHGAIKQMDVQLNILPVFAAEVQAQVVNNPTDPNSQSLLGFFDDGGTPGADAACGATCQNSDGTCAKADDGKIDICEVTSNAAVQGILASDVQMYSDDGSTYGPSAANTHKDSLSLGIGFTTVAASF